MDLQHAQQHQYLRVHEAQRCEVLSAVLLPIYGSAHRAQPMAVFELVQNISDVPFDSIVDWLGSCLRVRRCACFASCTSTAPHRPREAMQLGR